MATQARRVEAQIIDPATRSGFRAIAAAHGTQAAHDARRETILARFELRYPEQARILRELGKFQ